jgi:ketosteroid isomerase-like protein
MTIKAERARELLYALHDAWNARDIERLIACYVDDMTYWANFGGPDGGALTIAGKDAFRAHLRALSGIECISVPHHFRFADGLGRASVEFYIRDPGTGHKHAATYRQIASYRDDKILRLEEYHDAKALAAFLDLVSRK